MRSRALPAISLWALASSALGQVPGMVQVNGGGGFCIDAYEASVDGSGRAVSVPGAWPAVSFSMPQAEAACRAAGKRLCTDSEWLRACQGPFAYDYPYGDQHQEGACNDGGASFPPTPGVLEPTGTRSGCATVEGALDMVGNVLEWTADPAGTFRGGSYYDSLINGPGCRYTTAAHGALYQDQRVGFRCCADAGLCGPTTVQLPPLPDAGPDLSPGTGATVTLFGKAFDPNDDPITAWQWSVRAAPQGATYELENADSRVARLTGWTEGTYVLQLVACDQIDCGGPDSREISFGPPPENDPPVALMYVASPAVDQIREGSMVCLRGEGSYDLDNGDGLDSLELYWDLGDAGATAYGVEACHAYLVAGDYTVSLTVVDVYGAAGAATLTLNVKSHLNQPPVAEAWGTVSVYAGQRLGLAGNASDPDGDAVTGWQWQLTDAPPGAEWTVTGTDTRFLDFTAATPGDYVFSLVVTDSRGAVSAPAYATIHVANNLPPVAVATIDTAPWPDIPLSVCFDGSQSYDPEIRPLVHEWAMGDGTTYATASGCHQYALPGTYAVTFLVVDEVGAADVESFSVVLSPLNQPPVATPMAAPNNGSAPLRVQFSANASDPEGDPLAYSWDFGDGGSGTARDPTHVYVSPGTYAAWLTVSDGKAAASASLTIVVNPPIPAIELNVTKADIDFKSRKSQLAHVAIQAELYSSLPGGDDVVALHVDGALVFAAPFGHFEPARRHGAVVPGAYKLKAKHLWVMVDFTEGRLAIEAEKVLLAGYAPANGVDIEVMIGDAMAVDNVQPVDERGERHYRHHRAERGRGNCYR